MDISLLFNANGNPFLSDIAIDGVDLKTSTELADAIEMSIFSNRRANVDDVLPYPNDDPQGWFGDTWALVPGDQIGSRLWQLVREVQSSQTELVAKNFVVEALAWLTADGIVPTFTVKTSFIQKGILGIEIDISKPTGSQKFKYSYVWDQI